jgi:hypothetical protein
MENEVEDKVEEKVEDKSRQLIIFTGVCFLTIAFVGILVLVLINASKKGSSSKYLNLGGTESSSIGANAAGNGEYKDSVCKVAFKYPKNWLKADRVLPLPQEPLASAVFDEPTKNSLFSYLCFDANKYSFEQFISQSPLGQSQTESFSSGQTTWQRNGDFIYTTKNDKLIIFQMFFTKYDLKPETGYENTFLNLIKSVSFY